MVDGCARREAAEHLAAAESGEFTEDMVQTRMDKLGDQGALAPIIGFEGGEHAGSDILLLDDFETGRRGERLG